MSKEEIEIILEDHELELIELSETGRFLEWIKKELELNPDYLYHNRDFNGLSGVITPIVIEELIIKESKKTLNTWLLEEVFLNPDHYFTKDLLKKLSINVNEE
jgi:hypothetical protein